MKDREELYCFHQTQTVDFCHVNSEILDEIQEIKKAKWNGFKTNISEVIELKGWGCAFLVSSLGRGMSRHLSGEMTRIYFNDLGV